jgi:short-subunit dehydrogenase
MGTAIVTGASSGLGLEIATLLGKRGYDVVLIARSAAALDQLATGIPGARTLATDLSTPEGVRAVIDAVPSADLVVNNAGFGECGPFVGADKERARQMVELNCTALTSLCGAYLPGMVERGAGQILNIASTAAFQPGPEMAVYYATKAYVLSFTEALAEELRGSPVTATAFCPGAFRSSFFERAGAEGTRLVKGRKLPSSQDMAIAALKALDAGTVVAVPGFANKLGAVMPRFTPRPILRRAVHYIQREV